MEVEARRAEQMVVLVASAVGWVVATEAGVLAAAMAVVVMAVVAMAAAATVEVRVAVRVEVVTAVVATAAVALVAETEVAVAKEAGRVMVRWEVEREAAAATEAAARVRVAEAAVRLHPALKPAATIAQGALLVQARERPTPADLKSVKNEDALERDDEYVAKPARRWLDAPPAARRLPFPKCSVASDRAFATARTYM